VSEPTIAEAKALAKKYHKRGVIIITFEGDYVSAASYGWTALACREMGRVSDQIVTGIEEGTIG